MEVDALPRPVTNKVASNPNDHRPTSGEMVTTNGKRSRDSVASSDNSDSELSSLGDASDAEAGIDLGLEKKPATRQRKALTSKRPAAKRTRITEPATTTSLHSVPVLRRATKARKPRESVVDRSDKSLYGQVFGGEMTIDHVCAEWINRFRHDETTEMASLFTFVLRAAGCAHEIHSDVVQDPDHFAEKLTDIQDEYQNSEVTEYPLGRKFSATFKQTLQDFFNTLIRSSIVNLLFDQLAFMDNLHGWVGTMTSAGSRPFRHTSTVISLSIITALCDVGKEILIRISATNRQLNGEKRKARPNAGRVSQFEQKLAESDAQIETLNTMLTTWFDTVFLHRYRDIEPKIRVECVQALGTWISTYPDVFFDGQYLRYLGWLLSDTNTSTRLEVVKQLSVLFSDQEKVAGLSTFNDRFHPRIIEMAIRDADSSVRSVAIDLLAILRDVGLLEPNDIETIGRLIFDSEPKVRRSIVPFFSISVDELYEQKIEEFGGEDMFESAVDEAVRAFETTSTNDLEQPSQEWLKLKCVVDLLDSYDLAEGPEPVAPSDRGVAFSSTESRFSVAAKAICDHSADLAEVLGWQGIAAYLLVDHSSSSTEKPQTGGAEQFWSTCRLNDRQHSILLEVLNASLRHCITSTSELQGNKSRLQMENATAAQEETAKKLAHFLPRLLSKFGDQPATASAVLRLEPALNLQIFQALRQESTVLAGLLDDINKQFMTHGSESVLADATRALLHAKSFDDLDEITVGRFQTLWEDTLMSLHTTIRTRQDARARGKLGINALTNLASTVLRLAKLSEITDSSDILDELPPKVPGSTSSRPSGSEFSDSLSCVAFLLLRGIPGGLGISGALSAKEDSISMDACRIITFYFLWQIKKLTSQLTLSPTTSIPPETVEALLTRRNECFEMMTKLLVGRPGADDVKCACAISMLEIAVAFSTLRRFRETEADTTNEGADDSMVDNSGNADWTRLLDNVSVIVQESAVKILGSLELALAKRLGRTIEQSDLEIDNDVGIEADPESDNEEDEADPSDGRDNIGPSQSDVSKLERELIAEQRLCYFASKLVLACESKVVDPQIKERLSLNKARLGPNYRELVDFFDRQGGNAPRRKKEGLSALSSAVVSRAPSVKSSKNKSKSRPKKKSKKSSIVVSDDESSQEEDEEDDEFEEIEEVEAQPEATAEVPKEDEMEDIDSEPEIAADAEGDASELSSLADDD